ncbi:Major facilitator superfamily, partial [Trinorchestia longiramus]
PSKTCQYLVLALLWLTYASSYLLRKPLALVKTNMMLDLDLSLTSLGLLDVALLLPYALVSLSLGWLADAWGARLVLGLGLCIAAFFFALIGQASSMIVVFVLLLFTGASLALCWPTSSAILTEWFKPCQRNLAFGIFGTSCFAGSILATYLAVYLLEIMHWRSIFFPCSVIPGVCGILVLFALRSPQQDQMVVPDMESDSKCKGSSISNSNKSLTFCQILKLELMPEVCLSILFSKCVRYALLCWLPMFLVLGLQYSKVSAGIVSTVFDAGGVLGSLFIDFLVRYLFRSNNIFATFMSSILTCIFLGLFFLSSNFSSAFHVLLLFAAGMSNSAADILLTGPIAASLGVRYEARVAVSGVVNGVGSLGAVFQGPLVSFIGDSYGWAAVMPSLGILSLLGALTSYRAYRIHYKSTSPKKSASKS